MKKQEVVLYPKCFVFCTGQKLAWISMKACLFLYYFVLTVFQNDRPMSPWWVQAQLYYTRILLNVKVLARLVPLTCDSIYTQINHGNDDWWASKWPDYSTRILISSPWNCVKRSHSYLLQYIYSYYCTWSPEQNTRSLTGHLERTTAADGFSIIRLKIRPASQQTVATCSNWCAHERI